MNNAVLVDNFYQYGFHISDNFLDLRHLSSLRLTAELLYKSGKFRAAKIGQHHAINKHNLRSDQIFWIDEGENNPSIQVYLIKIKQLIAALNEDLFLGIVDFETHFSIYQPGSFYKKHIDQFSTNKNRRISCVYYLNENWENAAAGELKLYDDKKALLASILPIPNRFVCFRSDLVHEVCVTQKTRYSIAGWMKTRD